MMFVGPVWTLLFGPVLVLVAILLIHYYFLSVALQRTTLNWIYPEQLLWGRLVIVYIGLVILWCNSSSLLCSTLVDAF